MVQINFAKREVQCKVVYYGPARSGKTATLRCIHEKAPISVRGFLTSIATDAERTLFFDFLPLDLGEVASIRTKIHLYSVPFIDHQNASRLLVLDGVDGVVFVADSDPARQQENADALRNLEENLKSLGRELGDLPLVFQWNRRDVPGAAPVETMRAALGGLDAPGFESVAAGSGAGVMAALKAITQAVLLHVTQIAGVSAPQKARRPATAEAEKRVLPPRPVRPPAPEPAPAPAPSPVPAAAAAPDLQSAPEEEALVYALADAGEEAAVAARDPAPARAGPPSSSLPPPPGFFAAPTFVEEESESERRRPVATPRWRSPAPAAPPPESPGLLSETGTQPAASPASPAPPVAPPSPAPPRHHTSPPPSTAEAGRPRVAILPSNAPVTYFAEPKASAPPEGRPPPPPAAAPDAEDMDFSALLERSEPEKSAQKPAPRKPAALLPTPRPPPRAAVSGTPNPAPARSPRLPAMPARPVGWERHVPGERAPALSHRATDPRPGPQSSRGRSADMDGAEDVPAANLAVGALFAVIALAAIGYLVYAML